MPATKAGRARFNGDDMGKNLTFQIGIGMAFGLLLGDVLNAMLGGDTADAKDVAG